LIPMGRAKVKRGRRRVLFWIIAGLLIGLFTGSILLLRSIALPHRYRGLIESRLRAATDRDVEIRGASLRFLGGIGIEFQDLVIKHRNGKSDFIRARNLILQMKLLPLLRRQLKWKLLIIEKPSVHLQRSREGNFNFGAKGKESILRAEKGYPYIRHLLSSFTGGEIKIRKGSIHFEDDFVASGPIIVGVENLCIELTPISIDAPIAFRVQARQPNSKGPDGRISIIGKVHPLPDPIEWSKIRMAAEVRAKNVNVFPFRPYYAPHIPVEGVEGFLDIHAHYEGNFSGLFRSRGQIKIRDVAFNYPHIFNTVLNPKKFVVDYDVRLNRRNLIISDVSFRVPEVEIRGRCTIHEIRSPKRRIEAFATTGSFRYNEVKKYLPLRIISPGFATFLGKVTRRGKGRIVSLRIKGLIEDFPMLKDPKKADLIYGKMRLDGVAFPFAEALNPIENIFGWMILEEGFLRFQDLKGSYGKSRFNAAEVTISRIYSSPQLNLALDGEIDLDGIMDMAKPGASIRKGIPIRDMFGMGNLQLRVSGELSDPSKLSYNGHLVLKGAGLSIKGVRDPVTGVSGNVVFSKNRFRLMDLKGKMGNSAFWGKGQMGNPWLGKRGEQGLNLTLRGKLDLRELFSRILPDLFPRISRAMRSFSGISGGAQLTLDLRGRGNGFKGIRYKGRLSLGETIFRHHRMVSPVRFLNGEVHFTPKIVRLSKMEARLKGSHLKIEGSVRDYLSWERSIINLRIRAPNLDIGDFEPQKGGEGEWIWKGGIGLPQSGVITLRVEEGKWRYTDFSNLTAGITLAEGRLNLERFHCEVKGGTVDVTAWVDLAKKGEVAFALNPKLSHVDAGRFFKDLGLEERVWIAGIFNLWGNLMGRGSNGKELRRSLEGKLRVGMEKGRIRRFRVLSKVFSLLNVLQLFKGKLPGLTGEGLPYNTITGEIGIAKGIARTSNLLVDSDAMKISIIGEADIAREALDLTVGLRPLGTVDTIVSSVPVVGRILAGEDKSIIAYYVEVKGNFSNPQVKHIPLKSMEKGLIGMIRRVLEAPIHIIPMGKE